MDREKVIRQIEVDIERANRTGEMLVHVSKKTATEALTMLKEQEAKEVKESTNMYTGLPITHCPKCGVSLNRYLYGRRQEGQINYCPMCGQAVKWE